MEKRDQVTGIKRVKFQTYKSIKDCEVEFKPGLNIIIGKNADGKSNFLTALYEILAGKYTHILYHFMYIFTMRREMMSGFILRNQLTIHLKLN